jgi:serine/threonine-protein kinase
MERCTLKGAGLVAFERFSASDPMNVDMSGCAVLADALIAWGPDANAKVTPPTREALAWTGQANLYDIRGKSWVSLSGAAGAGPVTPMPDGPADLGAWVKLLGTEQNPLPPPVKFATDPASLPAHPTPADFAVMGQDATPPGADPAMVGPGATVVKN